MRHGLAAVLAALILLIPTIGQSADVAVTLRVAVAANFRQTLEQLLPAYTQRSGVEVKVTSASTGILSAQIQRGAPFDVFLAADQERPTALAEADPAITGSFECYAVGSLTVLGVESLSALRSPNERVAIANPRFAPYGKAAMEVISELRDSSEPFENLVYGTNVQQAFQFYESGAADIAIVASSIGNGAGIPVPPSFHSPIEQHGLVLARSTATDAAIGFLEFLQSEDAIEIMRGSGYQPCS